MTTAKEAARSLIDQLPEDATWDDIMFEFYVKQKVEAGRSDVAAGETVPHEEVIAGIVGRLSQGRGSRNLR